MIKLSKRTFYLSVLLLLLSISNSFSQSEQDKINTLIKDKVTYNENNKASVVYKIQLYNGNEKEAAEMKQNFSEAYPDYSAELVYNAPEWKTHVGKFKTRLEADSVLIIIQENFAGAIVLEDKI